MTKKLPVPAVERRNFLKHVAAAAGGAIVMNGLRPPLAGAEAMEGYPAPSCGLSPMQVPLYQRDLNREVEEIRRFEARCAAKARKEGKPRNQPVKGISIPFATLPLNVYMRDSEFAQMVTAPKIPVLLGEVLTNGGQAALQYVVRKLWAKLPPIDGEMTEEITTKPPKAPKVMKNRIVTPRYILDVEQMDERKLAAIVAHLAEGIHAEMLATIECAVGHAKEVGLATTLHLQYRELRVAAKLQGWMWDGMAYTMSSGWVG